MSWNPEEFKDLPSTETPIDAKNLNHMNQGILLGVNRSKEAKDTADNLNELYQSGALNGEDGEEGRQLIQST